MWFSDFIYFVGYSAVLRYIITYWDKKSKLNFFDFFYLFFKYFFILVILHKHKNENHCVLFIINFILDTEIKHDMHDFCVSNSNIEKYFARELKCFLCEFKMRITIKDVKLVYKISRSFKNTNDF